jgi:sulfatase maturation enzyme AslB (radical SAM superfamily)
VSWEVAQAACDLLLAAGTAEPELGFRGGEPLLEIPLMRRVASYLERQAPPGARPRLGVTTNGTRVDAEALRFLAAWRARTGISFDGVEPAQELRAPGTFACLDASLGRLRTDFPGYFGECVTIGMTLNSANLPFLAASVRYFLERGVRSLALAPQETADPGWDARCCDELDRQLAEAARLCRDHHQRTGEVPFWPFRPPAGRRPRRPQDAPMCRLGDGHALFVDVDGTVTGCGQFAPATARLDTGLARRAAAAATVGHVTDPDLDERLARSNQALRAVGLFHGKERKRSPYRSCGACPLLGECRVCPMAIAAQPGNEDPDLVPPLPCAFTMLAAKHRRRVPRPRSGAPAFG